MSTFKLSENLFFGFSILCSSGKRSSSENDDTTAIENALHTIKFMGIFYCLASLGCFACGVFTLWFAQSNLVFPYNTASGIWTGIFTFVLFILGCRITKHFSISNPEYTKRLVIWYYMCTIMNDTFSLLHVSYSAVGYTYCRNEIRSGMDRCFTDEMPRLMLMEGFSVAFGTVIFLFSLFGTVYISTGRRLNKLTGTTVTGNGSCEVQNNCCV